MTKLQHGRLKVLVAMSGGVDSSVTAAFLKEQGHDVGGATFKTWISDVCETETSRPCCSFSGAASANEVAQMLDIPFWFFDFERDFRKSVVDYFAAEYLKGRTPNPCIACNRYIKFRQFLSRARELGYEYIATGHYARIGYDEKQKSCMIEEGEDLSKDQSYVLFSIEKEILPYVLFPLGDYKKTEIRKKAAALGLPVKDKPDSQEICFIPANDYGAFLEREYAGDESIGPQINSAPGVIRMRDGKVLGQHEGYFRYTRGQRRGLGVAFKERLYVLDTNPGTREVIVGTKSEVMNNAFVVTDMNWFLKPESPGPFKAHVKIRAQHKKASATVSVLEDQTVKILFDENQEAITPGQAAVIYEGPRVLGGGWIDRLD